MYQPVTVLQQYGDRVKLRLNRKENGIDTIKWYTTDPDNIKYVIPKKNITTVAGFEEGYYYFYTTGENFKSPPMEVYFQRTSYKERLDILWSYAALEDTVYNQELYNSILAELKQHPSWSILFILYRIYLQIDNSEDFEDTTFYKLISIQEKYENLRMGSANRGGGGFCKLRFLPIPELVLPYLVNTVIIFKVDSELHREFYRKIVIDSPSDTHLMLDPNTFYEIELWSDDCLSVTFQHWQMNSRMLALLWADIMSNNSDYNDITEDDFRIPTGAVNFDEEEKQWYLIDKSLLTHNPIFPRIEVEEGDERAVTLRLKNLTYANASSNRFYLGGKDAEFWSEAIVNTFMSLNMNNASDETVISFNVASTIIDREAILYITDDRGNIVSRVTRCYFDDDVETSMAKYNEKIRLLELTEYEKRVIPYLNNLFPAYSAAFTEIIDRAEEDSEVNIDNILLYFLEQIELQMNPDMNKDDIIFAILKDWFANSRYSLSFFDHQSLLWRPYLKRISAEPQERQYVLCTYSLLLGQQHYTTTYQHSGIGAIDYFCNQYGKYITYAISEEDYTYSGFVYVNTVTDYVKNYLVNLEVR